MLICCCFPHARSNGGSLKDLASFPFYLTTLLLSILAATITAMPKIIPIVQFYHGPLLYLRVYFWVQTQALLLRSVRECCISTGNL